MKKLIVCLLAISTQAFAVEEYYSLSKSVRSLGMGGAFYTLSDDEHALFYNPAGLSNYRGNGSLMFSLGGEISTGATSAIKTIMDQKGDSIGNVITALNAFQGKPVHAGFNIFPHYVRKNFAIGLLLADTKTNFAILGKDLDTTVDLTMIVDNGLFIGFGRQAFLDDLHLGFNIKGIIRAGGKKSFAALDFAAGKSIDLDPNTLGGVGGGVDMDLGAIYDVKGLPFGVLNQVSLTLNNLLASDLTLIKPNSGGGSPPRLQRMFTLGARSVLPGVGPIDQFHVLFDLAEFGIGGESDLEFGSRGGSFFKHVNFGVEAPINGWLMLRTGFHQGYLTAGLGIQVAPVKLDIATYSEELSTGINRLGNRRIALRLAIGAGSSAPPPVPPKTSLSIKTEGSTEPAAQPPVTDPAKEPVKDPLDEKAKDEKAKDEKAKEEKAKDEKAKEEKKEEKKEGEKKSDDLKKEDVKDKKTSEADSEESRNTSSESPSEESSDAGSTPAEDPTP